MSVLAPSKRRRSAGERPLFVLTLRPEARVSTAFAHLAGF